MASGSTKYYEEILIEGYIRNQVLIALPNDIKQLLIIFHYNDNYFLDGADLCTINSIGNILSCRYSKLQLIQDIMMAYLSDSSGFIVIRNIAMALLVCILCFWGICIMVFTSYSMYFAEYPSTNNYYVWAIILIITVCITINPIMQDIDAHSPFRGSSCRNTVCFVSKIMKSVDYKGKIVHDYRLRLL